MAMFNEKMSGSVMARVAARVTEGLSKIVVSAINGLVLLAAILLSFLLIHYEALNQASLIPREGQYAISFGISAATTLCAIMGFLGLFEYLNCRKVQDDVDNLYPQITDIDPSFEQLLTDTIADYRLQMFKTAIILIPLSLGLQVSLILLVWENIPFAIDYFQMTVVQDAITGELIRTNERDSIMRTLQGFSVSIGFVSYVVAICVGMFSPPMRDERDFMELAFERYRYAQMMRGVNLDNIQDLFDPTMPKLLRKAPSKPAAGSVPEASPTPPAASPIPSPPPTSSGPAAFTPPPSFTSLGQTKAVLSGPPFDFNFDKFMESVLSYCGLEKIVETGGSVKYEQKEFPNTDNSVKQFITSNGTAGTKPEDKLAKVTDNILGTDTSNGSGANTGIKGFSFLMSESASLTTAIKKAESDLAIVENDLLSIDNNINIASSQGNTALQDQYEVEKTTLTAKKQGFTDIITKLKNELTQNGASINAVVADLKVMLQTKNIGYK